MTSSNGNIFRVTGHLCGEFTGPGEFPTQRPVTRSFDVYFDLRLNKRLCKQSWGWWFQTLLCPLWRHSNVWTILLKSYLPLVPHNHYMRQWNGSSLVQVTACRPATTWINAGSMSIGLMGTNVCEIWIGILSFSFKKKHLKLSSANMAAILSSGRWIKNNSAYLSGWIAFFYLERGLGSVFHNIPQYWRVSWGRCIIFLLSKAL